MHVGWRWGGVEGDGGWVEGVGWRWVLGWRVCCVVRWVGATYHVVTR